MNRLAFVLILLAATTAVSAAPQRFADDFSRYTDGTTGEPTWSTDSVQWETRDAAFRCTAPSRTFAIYSPAPYADEQVVEATVTISGNTTDQWKIAGVVVWQNNGNFWHLALVEAPKAMSERHSIELVEAYDGAWLAEGAADTKVTPVDRNGAEFDWRYNRPYRLRLRLTRDLVEGTVAEAGGQTVSRIAYRLDNPRSVRAGYAGLDSGGFKAQFDDFSLEVTSTTEPPVSPAPPPASVRSWTGLRGDATGFFRVIERDGRWWLLDPDGAAFYIIGTDHANYNVHWCEALGYAPYHRNMVEKYGSEEAWAKSTVARLKAWGFNSVAANHSPSLRHQGLAHMELLGFGQSFAAFDDICPQVHWTGFPNVFSPKWTEHCRKYARQRCAQSKNDPWLIGYFLDNELEWYGKSYRPWGLADEAFKKPATHTAKIALVEFLKNRYNGNVAAFNRAWGTTLRDFDSLLRRRTPIAEDRDAARADKMAFVRVIAERYFAGCAEALRELDPNHLNLGCRFAGQAPDIWDIAGKLCDIVSVNCYRQADLDRKMILDFEQDLRRWHQAARRPLMITEWSFPALDSGLPCQHGAGQRFDTQAQRAAAWRIFQELLFRMPYVVGSDYFMWVDEPAQGISTTFPEDSNYGLVNEQDEPYGELTRIATEVNARVYTMHTGQIVQLRPELSGDPPRLTVHNDGAADATMVARLWIDGQARDLTLTLAAGRQLAVPLELPLAPGAHFVQCVLDPQQALVEGNRADNEAHAAWYVPGLPWPDDRVGRRVPLVLANATDEALRDAVLRVAMPRGFKQLRAWAPGAGWVGCAADAERGQAIVTMPELTAHAAATVLLYDLPSDIRGVSETAARGGSLEVVPGREGEKEAVILLAGGQRVGHLVPLVWERTTGDNWVQPELKGCIVRRIGDVTEIRATLSYAGRDASGVIPRVGAPQPPPEATRAFTCEYEVTWVQGRQWFTARMLSLRSDDPRPWECKAYFHYLLPEFAAKPSAPGVPNYYRPFDGWSDDSGDTSIGAMALAPGDFHVSFWKDEGGGLHPDASRDISRRFRHGDRFAEPQPEIAILVTQGVPLRDASFRIWQQAQAERMLEKSLLPAERQPPSR
jgi:hypothetical protein